MATAPLLLIDGGDLPSLVAAMLQPDGGRIVLFHGQRDDDDDAAARLQVLAEHERIIRPAAMIFGRVGRLADSQAEVPAHVLWLNELALAAAAAFEAGCRTIIWPVQIGIDAEGLGRAMETAQLVGDIAGLADQSAADALLFKLPLADRTDQEIVMLAEELGVPMRACWPCDGGGDEAGEPCDRCAGCRRWMTAFGAARVSWPWAKAAAR